MQNYLNYKINQVAKNVPQKREEVTEQDLKTLNILIKATGTIAAVKGVTIAVPKIIALAVGTTSTIFLGVPNCFIGILGLYTFISARERFKATRSEIERDKAKYKTYAPEELFKLED